MKSKFTFILTLYVLVTLISCKTGQLPSTLAKGMYKVTILYPNGEGKTFDMDYYEQKHMPMVANFIGDNLKFYEIDKVISGRTPNDQPPHLAVGYFYVSNIAEYNQAIGANLDAIVNDFKNYTNIQPMVQISEIQQVVYQK